MSETPESHWAPGPTFLLELERMRAQGPLTIDRGRWAPGKHLRGVSSSHLYSAATGTTCCLGELGIWLGAELSQLNHRSFPDDAAGACSWPKVLFEGSSWRRSQGPPIIWQSVLGSLNDALYIDDETRESWIAAGFKYLFGIDVIFTGSYGDGPRGEDGRLLGVCDGP